MGEEDNANQAYLIETLNKLLDSKLNIVSQSFGQSFRDLDAKLDHNFESLKSGIVQVSTDVALVKEEQVKQGQQIEELKKEDRYSNLVFYGLKQANYMNSLSKVIEILDKIGIQGSKYFIRNIRKLGKGNWDETPLLISFTSGSLKVDIMRKRSVIRENFEGVVVKEDLPKETRETRNQLKTFSKLAFDHKLKVQMKEDKLVINKKPWTLEELQNDVSQSFLNSPKRPRDEDISPNGANAKKGNTLSRALKNMGNHSFPASMDDENIADLLTTPEIGSQSKPHTFT